MRPVDLPNLVYTARQPSVRCTHRWQRTLHCTASGWMPKGHTVLLRCCAGATKGLRDSATHARKGERGAHGRGAAAAALVAFRIDSMMNGYRSGASSNDICVALATAA